jgi:protein gp37
MNGIKKMILKQNNCSDIECWNDSFDLSCNWKNHIVRYTTVNFLPFNSFVYVSRNWSTNKLWHDTWKGSLSYHWQNDGLPRIEDLKNTPASVKFLSIEPLLEDLGVVDFSGIDWVIVGGESGAKSRPMHESWVLSIKSQCEEKNIAFFFKQWGGKNKKKNGRLLLGRTYDEFPKFKMELKQI